MFALTRPRKKLLIGFVFPVALIFGFLIVEHFRGPWLLKRWKARMAARGEVFDIDKLARPLVLPDQNGLPQLIWVASQLSAFPTQLQPPAAKYVAPAKVILISQVPQWPSSWSRNTNVSWVEVAEQLAPLEAQIQEALQILASERFSANLHYRSGFSMLLPHLARLKSAAQVLLAAALHDVHQGQLDAAFAKLNGMLALVEVEKDEPIIISQLVRIALAHIAFAATWQALQHDGWTDAQLAQLQRTWTGFSFPPAMEKAMSMERAIAAIEYERFRNSDLPLSQMFDGAAAGPATTPGWLTWNGLADLFEDFPQTLHDHALTPVWKFAWSHHDELYYCKILQRMLEAHREVLSQRDGATLPARMERIAETARTPYDRMRFFVAPMLYPALTKAFQRAWIAQATAELAVTAIAIKRFELRHGRFPGSPGELVPDFLARCPIDYMDGKELKYCLEADSSFRLYSVGIDGKDDGGDGGHAHAGVPNYHNGRDLVWPRPASEPEVAVWRTLRK